MIASKGQLVKLSFGKQSLIKDARTAKVLSLVYTDQPEGGRGVQLDREIGGSRWWMESALTEAN